MKRPVFNGLTRPTNSGHHRGWDGNSTQVRVITHVLRVNIMVLLQRALAASIVHA
jgi:hypothetical protein